MKNHYHLLLRSSERHLSQLMRPLNASCAQAFSRRHNRRGYLFQNRYKSIVNQDQGYSIRVLRCSHSPMSLAVRIGEKLAEINDFVKILIALSP